MLNFALLRNGAIHCKIKNKAVFRCDDYLDEFEHMYTLGGTECKIYPGDFIPALAKMPPCTRSGCRVIQGDAV